MILFMVLSSWHGNGSPFPRSAISKVMVRVWVSDAIRNGGLLERWTRIHGRANVTVHLVRLIIAEQRWRLSFELEEYCYKPVGDMVRSLV